MDSRSVFEIKTDAFSRLVLHNTISSLLPVYIVTEYQKSGGSWVGQMLSEYLDIPFPRNRYPVLSKSVNHGHLLPKRTMKNVLCVFRDGRDTMVSSYYHMLFESDKNVKGLVAKCRADLGFEDYNNIKENLPVFIEYLFTRHHMRSLLRPNQFTWREFVDSWWGLENVVKVKYEDLITDCVSEMERVLKEITTSDVCLDRLSEVVNKYSFENQSKRKAGVEDVNSFLRKGQPGDWKEKFNLAAAEAFNHFAGDQLISLGYELDSQWVESCK